MFNRPVSYAVNKKWGVHHEPAQRPHDKRNGRLSPPVPGQLGFGAFFQNRDSRQYLAFYELQEGAAAGGDVGDLVGDAELVDGGQGVTTASDGEGRGSSDGFGDHLGAFGELVELEHTDLGRSTGWSWRS